MPTPDPAPDRALAHDVRAVLALPEQRRAALVVPLACDVLDGEYGTGHQAHLAGVLVRRRLSLVPRRPDVAAARQRVHELPADQLAEALRRLAGTG